MILWIRYTASVLSLALVYELIISSPATARRPNSDQRQTRLNKQHMESILTNIPAKINASFWNHLRDLGNNDWTQEPMEIVHKFKQQFSKIISNRAGNNKFPQYLYPSIDRNITSGRTNQSVLNRMSVLFNVLLRELHRHGSSRHNRMLPSDASNRIHLSDKCERTKRETPLYPNNGPSLEHAQAETQQNISYTDKQNVSGQYDDNERITISPLTESVQANESTSKPTRENNRKRVRTIRRSRRAYRSRVVTPKPKPKVECQTIVACIHPYISYLAGTIMFILVVYLIIVFGKCVCDDSF